MRVLKWLLASMIACLMMLASVTAADAAPSVPDPGPSGDFSWKGFNWQKRSWDGAPQFNRIFSAANVGSPDADGYVKLSITNPTGAEPAAAELQSTREGFGYGTYSTTVEKDVSALQKEVVWGCMFTYDPNAAPGYTELDLCEASAWGGGAAYGESRPVMQGHGYWIDDTKPPAEGHFVETFLAPSSVVVTHKMVWSPGKIIFETYDGTGFDGTLLKRTVLEGSTVPLPSKEQVHFNLWVTGGGGGDAAHVKPESVTIRDFSFVPEPAPAPSQTPTPTPSTSPVATVPAKAPTTPQIAKDQVTRTLSGSTVRQAAVQAPAAVPSDVFKPKAPAGISKPVTSVPPTPASSGSAGTMRPAVAGIVKPAPTATAKPTPSATPKPTAKPASATAPASSDPGFDFLPLLGILGIIAAVLIPAALVWFIPPARAAVTRVAKRVIQKVLPRKS